MIPVVTPDLVSTEEGNTPDHDPTAISLGVRHRDISDDEGGDEQTKESSFKRKKTSHILDLDNIPDNNVLFSLRSLVTLLSNQYACKCCRKATYMTLELETLGIASSLHVRCLCGLSSSAGADMKRDRVAKVAELKPGQAYRNRVNATDFSVNQKLLLSLQLSGSGRTEAKIIPGMLNLANNPMAARITDMQHDLGLAILKVGKEVLRENLEKEKNLSPVGVDGNKNLSVSNDARWDKRSAGRRYDSMSGCSVMNGNRTGLTIGLEPMSMTCVMCENNTPHDADVCAHNYEGTAKGMEATGAARLVKRLFEEGTVYVGEYVSDDDSSSHAVLTHSTADLIEGGKISEDEWPRYLNGAKKPDNGQLPINHPEICFLADKGHRVRGYANKYFALAGAKKSENLGVTKIDAERMKRRTSWTLRIHMDGTFEELRVHLTAVLEHHFDNHVHCGDWCKAKGKKGKEKKENSLRFRCKKKNAAMYKHFKSLHAAFMEEEKLKQLYHSWDTNGCEGFNKLIPKFLPKDRTFCKTIENKVRIHLACCLLSIGYEETYWRVFALTVMSVGGLNNLYLQAEDKQHRWRRNHRKKKHYKINRLKKIYARLKEGTEKQVADAAKNLTYESGMMGPGVSKEAATNNREKKTSECCPNCGLSSHRRITSKFCLKNPNRLREEEEGTDDEDDEDETTLEDEAKETSRTNIDKKKEKNKAECPHCGLDTHKRKSSFLCLENPRNVGKREGIGECRFFKIDTVTFFVVMRSK